MKDRLRIFLLASFFFFAPSTLLIASAQSSLIDAGNTEVYDEKYVLWENLNNGDVVTISESGNLSMSTFSPQGLQLSWFYSLNATINSARIDANQQLILACHDEGVFVFNLNTVSLVHSIDTADPVNDADWDLEGDVWIAYFAGLRRVDEYSGNQSTGVVTGMVNAGISAFDVLSDGRIAVGSYDSKTYIYGSNGGLQETLTVAQNYISAIAEDASGRVLIGDADANLYRLDSSTWSSEQLSFEHSHDILTIRSYNSTHYAIGAKQGRIALIDGTTMTTDHNLVASGDVLNVRVEFTGEVYAISTTASETRLRFFDIDSDLDSYSNTLDAFPFDPSQWADSDDDGYGDNADGNNPDAFPNDPTQNSDIDGDGYGDNPFGENPDEFPNNPDQWIDSDLDGYGDNPDGQDGDAFPEIPSQWANEDGDSFGDNPDGYRPDACVSVRGYSTEDRFGCIDSDLDGYSDPDETWSISDGADALPFTPTQWEDGDGDGYGDEQDGEKPDSCPWEAGNSTKAIDFNESHPLGFQVITMYGCVDLDGDQFNDRSESLNMDTIKSEQVDFDGDGVGRNADYDDSRANIQTEQHYCLATKNDTSEACLAWNDPEYQAYLNNLDENTISMTYGQWKYKQENPTSSNSDAQTELIIQVSTYGGIIFIILTVSILGIAKLKSKKPPAESSKAYADFGLASKNTAIEALEGKAGLSASGGVVSDGDWDDQIEEFKFDEDEEEESSEGSENEEQSSSEATIDYSNESSIEEIAGVVPEVTSSQQSGPPLPASGLPDGWTMEQWQWYGQEWLDKQG
jgi:hypothetical protein